MRIWLVTGVTILLGFFITSHVHAVQISPLRETRVVAPGTFERFEITITNDGAQTVTYTGDVDAFRIDPKQGTPIFGEYSRALPWFSPGPDITLRPGESGTMWFSLSVPEGAPPESFYLGLFAAEKNLRASAKVGTLLFLHTQGETRESLTLQTLSASMTKNVEVHARIDNTGEIHVVPRGQILLEVPLTGYRREMDINPNKHMILPGEYGEFSGQFSELPWYAYGRIRIQANVFYGLTNQTIVHTTTLWRKPPMWFLVLIPSIIGAGIVFIIFHKRSHAH